jgi:LysR family transcriptional regulator, benzoate and cis,cis-muconate-responsive activator of ben and cat genes
VIFAYQPARRYVTELRHLRYFVAVAEQLSFRRAAQRLHLSHAALSRQIQDLEEEIHFMLFERNARRVQLTEAGRVFLVGARRVIADANVAVTQGKEASKGERGRLVIAGGLSALTGIFLQDALARFRARFPLVEVSVLHMNHQLQIRALLDGSIMLGIGFHNIAAHEDTGEQLCARLLLRSSVGIVCTRDRQFPKAESLALRSLQDEKFISLWPEVAYGYEDWLRDFCRRLGGFEPEIRARTNSSDGVRNMVVAGLGIFLCSEFNVRDQAPLANFYLLKEGEGQFELYAKWNKSAERSGTIHKFIETMQESIKDRETLIKGE